MTTSLVRTRPATLDDVPALCAFYRDLSAATLERRFHVPLARVPDRLVRALAVPPTGWSLVAEQGEEVVGHACAGMLGSVAEVGLVVDDAFQGTGIGTRLMRELATAAEKRGIAELVCTVDPDNVSVLATVLRAGLAATQSSVDGAVEIRIPLRPALGSLPHPA